MTAPLLFNLHSLTTESAFALVRDAIGLGEFRGATKMGGYHSKGDKNI